MTSKTLLINSFDENDVFNYITEHENLFTKGVTDLDCNILWNEGCERCPFSTSQFHPDDMCNEDLLNKSWYERQNYLKNLKRW